MKTLLVIAGLDPTAGAGLLADARVAADHGVRAVGVATALTVQDTHGVRSSASVSAEVISAQLELLLADVSPSVVKIGMLGSEPIALAVARVLAGIDVPIVWDPVLLPSCGGVSLLVGDVQVVAAGLLPLVRVVTPNLFEATILSRARAGSAVEDVASMRVAAATLRAAGARAVLVKGGHLPGTRAIDVLHDGERITELDAERVVTGPLHGTGCVLSTAIACELARHASLSDAVRRAKVYLGARLRAPLAVGRGAGCLI